VVAIYRESPGSEEVLTRRSEVPPRAPSERCTPGTPGSLALTGNDADVAAAADCWAELGLRLQLVSERVT
jgi:hypothetical protein